MTSVAKDLDVVRDPKGGIGTVVEIDGEGNALVEYRIPEHGFLIEWWPLDKLEVLP